MKHANNYDTVKKITLLFSLEPDISKADQTARNIICCAREEFLSEGFSKASLRKIASAANVTTGAIYRYFENKEVLFYAVTDEAVHLFRDEMATATEVALTAAEQGISYGLEKSMENMARFYRIVYQHFDQFYLLFMYGDELETSDFYKELVEMEDAITLSYLNNLKKHYGSRYEIDEVALHFLVEAYISAIVEPIRHRMTEEEALFHGQNLSEYFARGWLGLEEQVRHSSK